MNSDVLLRMIKNVLSYDPETGIFRWTVKRKGISKEIAGTIRPMTRKDGRFYPQGGYVVIVVFKQSYLAHQLAYWFMTGRRVPIGFELDHKNRQRADNRWDNLRIATRGQNATNSKVRNDSESGYAGVALLKKPWQAYIQIDGKQTRIGAFATKDEALAARHQMDRTLNRASNGSAGVSMFRPWVARIRKDSRVIRLGRFDTMEEAIAARSAAEIQYHGEFRRQ